jgi:hypothetical protein
VAGEIRWVVQLRTPADTTLEHRLTSTSLAFSSFDLQPNEGDIYEWRMWGEKNNADPGAWSDFCAPTHWWSFGFGPLPDPADPPDVCLYTAIRNPTCRASDYVESDHIAVLQHGDGAELVALNPELTHGKFELASMQQCWILLGLMDGPDNPVETCAVPVVDPAPKPADAPTPTCSPDLDRETCEDSGGTWNEGASAGPQCVCP